MEGIHLVGGTGSRSSLPTPVTHEHLLPVARAPMIIHPAGGIALALAPAEDFAEGPASAGAAGRTGPKA